MKTIPELAEDLRRHINTDNAAKRLIVEHILPLIGMEFDSPKEATAAPDRIEELESDISHARADLKDIAATLDEVRTDMMNDGGNPSVGDNLNRVSVRIRETITAYLTAP